MHDMLDADDNADNVLPLRRAYQHDVSHDTPNLSHDGQHDIRLDCVRIRHAVST